MLRICSLIVILGLLINSLVAQQLYPGNYMIGCNNTDAAEHPTSYLYSCNGNMRVCQAYLIFRSQHNYDSVTTISNITSASSAEIARMNNVSKSAIFPIDKQVIVPVNCSCSGQYYQANASYIVNKSGESYYTVANDTYQGLSTCDALIGENPYDMYKVGIGFNLTVPLRCACPTENQTAHGVKFVLTYMITWRDKLEQISEQFNVTTDILVDANMLSGEDQTIFPFTSLLIPLHNEPSSSQTIVHPSPVEPQPAYMPAEKQDSDIINSSKACINASKAWIYAVVGFVAGLAVATITGVLAYFLCLHKRKEELVAVNTNSTAETPSFQSIENLSPAEKSDIWDNIANIAKSINVYSYKELQRATENFSHSSWINGSVYRGVINGDLAAIKKKEGDVSQEINLLMRINHFNLIRLCGVCFDEAQWYLVYEYAANGTLSDWIHTKEGTDTNLLHWKQRIQIALDVATGLHYLHSYTNPPYVHKDLTSHHVFLDRDMRAKIGNIGRARSAHEEGEFALTKHIVGTKGYMAPEYLENGLVTPKLDVYAFGVLLMEIITGREVSASSDFRVPLLEGEDAKENLNNFMDPSLKGDYPAELASLVAKLIDNCQQKNPSARPSTDEVVLALSTMMDTTMSLEHKLSI